MGSVTMVQNPLSVISDKNQEGVVCCTTQSNLPTVTAFIDTITVTLDDPLFQNRVYNEITSHGMIQLIGVSNHYIMNTVFYSQQFAGEYTMGDVYTAGPEYLIQKSIYFA